MFQPSEIARRGPSDGTGLEYFVYVPRSAREGAPLTIAVHGISRNANEQACLLAPLAERHATILIAPHFHEDRFPDYQRLGRSGRGDRADLALQGVLREVGTETGADIRNVRIFGYSGGGQFAHRYVMAHPESVTACAIGAAGWFTFPDHSVTYPWGILSDSTLTGSSFDPDRFLRVPTAVFVGERDRNPQALALNKSDRVRLQQGESRFERGRRWIGAMSEAAQERGLATRFLFKVLPRSGHSFRRSVERGGLATAAFDFLFNEGSRPGRPRSNSNT